MNLFCCLPVRVDSRINLNKAAQIHKTARKEGNVLFNDALNTF